MLLHHEFIDIAKKFGKKLAIKDKTLKRELSFSKTLISVLVLAKKVKQYDDDIIGVLMPNSAGALISTLAITMAGKTPAMINYSTGAYENTEYAMNKCNTYTVLTSRQFLDKINCADMPGMVFMEDVMKTVSPLDKISGALFSLLPAFIIKALLPKTYEDDNAVILFTSGSEKDPKGVQLTHKNLLSNIADLNEAYKLGHEDTVLGILPLFHVFGFNANFWFPLLNGMTVVTYANPLDYKTIPAICREEEITLLAATPIFLAGYFRQSKEGDFAAMKVMLGGADRVPDWLRDGYQEKHGVELYEAYGTTETSPAISLNTPFDNRPGSIGKPLASVKVRIADLVTGETLAPGEEGKILVNGPMVMKGYFGDPAETASKLKDGWYDTGDIGTFDEDGYIWFKGRYARFTKIGGEMVSLVKTESTIEAMIPAEVDCCVIEIPHAIKGAQLVAAFSAELENLAQIKKDLRKQLPHIALPKIYVVIPELPKMGSGKIDFRSITVMVKNMVENDSDMAVSMS
jgi:acyl-[acyl-carrier-protein]-phospholipid O-acyltransferase/long-chain-fatty-acid--[acyl-carrier-protein] ligase